jgi:CheY-like chemotaxis protein
MVGKRGKILVVDDEHLVRWSVSRFLESEGFVVVEASSGPEALKILQNDDIRILTRVNNPELTIFVITAVDSPEPILSARQAGATHTFTKPIPFEELVGTIQKVV